MSGTFPSLASVAHRVTGVVARDDRTREVVVVMVFRDTVAFIVVGANDVARR